MSNALTEPVLAPHPEFSDHYRGARGKRAFLQQIFNETAADYDDVEGVAALGSGRWYRREALRRAGLKEGMRVLDVAMGTGLVAREAANLVGPTGRVIGVDPSDGMLGQAKSLGSVRAIQGQGEMLPLADEQFDLVSMGYALRHLADLRTTFAEFRRVLRPGGRVCILEITRPRGAPARWAFEAYFRCILPTASRVLGTKPRTRTLWHYYWETIEHCVPPATVIEALERAGFTDVRRNVSLGLFSEYVATRPNN
jgi:demethylmenaquinone methyltransferase/2-methoxy-6-polyprenyl-1,4-benzoquinol methylase